MNIEIVSAEYRNKEKTAYTVVVKDKDGEIFQGKEFPFGIRVGKKQNSKVYESIMEKISDIEIKDFVVSEETLAAQARSKRDALLKACDYYVMPDYPAKDLDAVKEYRQALRDIPTQESFPHEIIWPQNPLGGAL